ncbi:MAG: hypothetical protein PHH54_06785 [Candidatus Nanoarchaeia archaeon]|nr:hypothetical protein [Candidatus Nanoarchaeia archaeon]MDD5741661.1 hypothetical protein [Candidatus Nanoarchaeia archaeon]
MKYTFNEHQKNILIGVVAGLLSGIFFSVFEVFKDKGIWAWLVPLFVVLFYYVIVTLVTYPIAKYFSKKK